MRIGFVEPHLRQYGGIRRIVELSNALVRRGHEVTAYVPDQEPLTCDWIPFDGRIRHLTDGFADPLDVLVFNDERQWWLLEHFEQARLRVFYALHYSRLYGKGGSWECLRSPVDLIIANSAWTAERVAGELGESPAVVLGGINPDHFRPLDVPKAYAVLAVGDRREWKGTEVIREACRQLQIEPTFYSGKGLSQSEMAREYSAAEVFVVGSDFEGFGQPGLEALACGVPLVTTDNGGCREYAIDEETALVVPPREPRAMADAIARLRADRELARRLAGAGLELIRERFDWSASADAFEAAISTARSDPSARPRPVVRESAPTLSIVVVQWDQMHLTQRCVNSIRYHTDVPYELVIVDNGSAWDARSYAEQAADRFVGNASNLGFAVGMNQGLREARGEWVAFVNNDTVLPEGWASSLLEAAGASDVPGIVCPAVTTAGNPRTVRSEPGDGIEVLLPFERPPSAVIWVMRTETVRALGGFDEGYPIASGEDLDLAFKVWTNGLDVLFDQRVLVEHVGHGTSETKLEDRRGLWIANRERFLDRWEDLSWNVPKLDVLDERTFARTRATAAAVAMSMRRTVDARASADSHKALAKKRQEQIARLRDRLDERQAKAQEFKERLDQRRDEVAGLRAALKERDGKLKSLRDRLQRRDAEFRELERQLEEVRDGIPLLDERRMTGRMARRVWTVTRWFIPQGVRHRLVRRFGPNRATSGSGPRG